MQSIIYNLVNEFVVLFPRVCNNFHNIGNVIHLDLLIGTVDTWLIWNLTGGVDGGVYITDVTNASRTQLMNLETLEWDEFLFSFFNLPIRPSSLAKIHSSCEVYGKLSTSKIQVCTFNFIGFEFVPESSFNFYYLFFFAFS